MGLITKDDFPIEFHQAFHAFQRPNDQIHVIELELTKLYESSVVEACLPPFLLMAYLVNVEICQL